MIIIKALFQLYLVSYIIYVGHLTYIGPRLNIAPIRIEFIAKLVASLFFGFFSSGKDWLPVNAWSMYIYNNDMNFTFYIVEDVEISKYEA